MQLDDYLREQSGLLAWKAGGDEDALQEARIAVWRTLERQPTATRSYLDQAAKWRIGEIHRGESYTGEVRQHGSKGQDAARVAVRAPEEDAAGLAAADQMEAAELAAHSAEIASAVAELPEVHRKYVVARFWADMDRTEIGKVLGRNPGNLATTWRTQIQPVLAERLAHLAAA